MFCPQEHICVYREIGKSFVQSDSLGVMSKWLHSVYVVSGPVQGGGKSGYHWMLTLVKLPNTIPAFIPVFQLSKKKIPDTNRCSLHIEITVCKSCLANWDNCPHNLSRLGAVCSACRQLRVAEPKDWNSISRCATQHLVVILELQQCLACPWIVALLWKKHCLMDSTYLYC